MLAGGVDRVCFVISPAKTDRRENRHGSHLLCGAAESQRTV
jgi:hypothetical protein